MKEIFKLALRNLKEHKSKTIIIALFLVFGVAIVVLGNSFLESVNRGLEKDFRNNYTGDIAISIKPEKGTMIDLFGYQTTDISSAMSEIAAIPDLDKVMQIIENQEGIRFWLPKVWKWIFLTLLNEMTLSLMIFQLL